MEKTFTCVDVTKMVLEEATERFQPLWACSAWRLDYTLAVCRKLDEICAACDCDCFEVEVDEITMEIRMGLTAAAFAFSQKSVADLQMFAGIRFEPAEEAGAVKLSVCLPGVWERSR